MSNTRFSSKKAIVLWSFRHRYLLTDLCTSYSSMWPKSLHGVC